jgi:uncharacterized protein
MKSRLFAAVLILAAASLSWFAPRPALAQAAPKWETLKAAYDYEKNPGGKPLAVAEKPEEDEITFAGVALAQSRLTFTNGRGHTVTGLFLRPKADPVAGRAYPAAVLLHGLGSDKEAMARAFGRYFASKGFACVVLDAARHGERREPRGEQRAAGEGAFFEIIRETVTDYRLALDWLETRKDVDRARVGAFGYSMGAMMTAILGGVDERIKAGVLCVGGDPVITSLDRLPEQAKAVGLTCCPSLYVGRFAPRPVLMVNAKDDRIMLRPAAERLHDGAKKPSEIRWVPGGHALEIEPARDAMNWLIEKLRG